MTERSIFLAALDFSDAGERAAYVERACGDDVALRAQVEALLTTHEQTGGFLETPAVPPVDSEVTPTLVGGEAPPDHKPDKDHVSAESQLQRYLQPSARPGWLGRLGHYEIEMILGRGAFGVVAKAFDDKLHRVVAIKMMHPELAATSPPRQRFIREARTAAAVQHENIVGIYAVEEEPIPYLVMEFIPGDSLQQRLDRMGPLNVPEVLRIGRQLAAGLAAAHAANLIHRDIKPSNILLTGGLDERVKITDFGLARAVDDASLTQSGVIAGTPMYMAPEQARGDTLDHRADLFSLGSVLYQMVSGRPPFRAGNTIAVLKRVCDDAPRPITDVIPGTPEWLQTIIFRLLEKDRNRRFQTATEVAQLLERCQTELRVKGFVEPVPELDPKLQATTVELALSGSESKVASPGGRDRARREFRSALLRWMVLPLAMLAALPYFGQRLARWFDTPIPPLPKTEQADGLRFDGRDDYVEVTGLDWDYPQFTIEAMVTSSNASGQGTIAHLSGGTAKAIEFMALYDGAQADPGKRTSGARIQGKSPYVNAYGPFAGEVRQHRALSFDGRYLNYYINGVWQGQRFAEPHEGLQWRMTALHIGCDGELRSRFQGVIDQVRISRVARYTQNFPPVTSLSSDDKTLAMYDFREGTGDTLRDVSGNSHDGKVVGAEWVRRGIEPAPTTQPQNPPPPTSPKPATAPFDVAQAKKHQEEWAAYLKVPVEYTNRLGMTFRLIPPGEFLMGAPETDADAQPYEKPQHQVTLTQAYYMGATEVTVDQFRQFVEATKYVTEAESDGKGAFGVNPAVRQPANVWNNKFTRSDVDSFPVRCVSWQDANRYCEWLSRVGGRTARLPTEAEWEFACRAGTRTRYSFGDGVADTSNPPRGRGAPFFAVAKGPANPFGLHEMHGNVHEICRDSGRTYTTAAVTDPIGSVDPGTSPAIRGGAASGDVSRMRSSHRYLNDGRLFPGLNFATTAKGFRVVLVHPLSSSASESPRNPIDRNEPQPAPVTPARDDAPQSAIAPVDAVKSAIKVPVGQSPLVSDDFEWSEPVNLGPGVNSDQWNDHPTVTADGRTLVFVRHSDRQPRRLWQSSREDLAQPFGPAVKLFDDATSYSDSSPYLSHDGLTLWFQSTRPIAPNRSDKNIWVAHRRSRAEPFEKPRPLGPEVNTPETEGDVFVSVDGLLMLFTRGNSDEIFQVTRRTEMDDFGNPRALKAGFGGAWNGFPRLSADGRVLLFAAKLDEQSLWLATRHSPDAKFGVPVQLDKTVNVGEVSGPFLSADEKTLYFSSTRPGGFAHRDLWSSTRIRKRSRDAVPPNSNASSLRVITEIGTGVFGPEIAADGLSMWFHAGEDGEARTGRLVLWQASRQAANDPFQQPIRVEEAINNQPDHNLTDATLSADGLALCFCRTEIGVGKNSDLWLSTRSAGDASWSTPVSVGAGVNTGHGEWEPELSPSGLELFFHSERPNGSGGTDLWVSRRASREAEFGPAENLGAVINSSDSEGGAALSADGLTLLFHRIEPKGFGVWRATRKSLDAPFEAPQHMRIHMPADDSFFSVSLSGSGEELYGTYRSNGRTVIGISRQ